MYMSTMKMATFVLPDALAYCINLALDFNYPGKFMIVFWHFSTTSVEEK